MTNAVKWIIVAGATRWSAATVDVAAARASGAVIVDQS
jgi:hypothetical protein